MQKASLSGHSDKEASNLMFIRGYHNPYSVVVIFKFRRICS